LNFSVEFGTDLWEEAKVKQHFTKYKQGSGDNSLQGVIKKSRSTLLKVFVGEYLHDPRKDMQREQIPRRQGSLKACIEHQTKNWRIQQGYQRPEYQVISQIDGDNVNGNVWNHGQQGPHQHWNEHTVYQLIYFIVVILAVRNKLVLEVDHFSMKCLRVNDKDEFVKMEIKEGFLLVCKSNQSSLDPRVNLVRVGVLIVLLPIL
jgi:hypothetical protein